MNAETNIPRSHRRPDVADISRAKADLAAGVGVDHIVVGAWLLTWGKPGRKDFADWLNDQDG
jgi:predicted transcriptional regulator